MSDRLASLRRRLTQIHRLTTESPGYAEVRSALSSIIDAAFSGEEISSTSLRFAVVAALHAYWAVPAGQPAEQELLAVLDALYALSLDDPNRIPALEIAVPRDLVRTHLLASSAPPLRYVLDEGAIVLGLDPDPLPEREPEDAEQADGADDSASTDDTNTNTNDAERASDETAARRDEPNRTIEQGNSEQSNDEAEVLQALAAPPEPNEAYQKLLVPHAPAANETVDPTASADWTMDELAAKPILLYRHYRDLADDAFDNLSLVAQHRRERRHVESPDEEAWIVQMGDALAAIGTESLTAARRHFLASLDNAPESLWGSVFFLACVEGMPAARLLDELLSSVTDASESAATIADAVALGTSPELEPLIKDWAISPIEVKRAVAFAVCARWQRVDAESATAALIDPSRTVRLLALQGLRDLEVGRSELGLSLLPVLRGQWHVADSQLAWEAMLTTGWFGLDDAYRSWRRGELDNLGGYELDVIAMMGDGADLPRVRSLIETTGLDRRSLHLLARYGDPAVIPVLLHGLKDEELRDDAASALEVLLGPRLDTDARLEADAWSRVIQTIPMRANQRLWFGEPYLPTTFLREVEHGRCSLVEMERILEELRLRTSRIGATALHGWHAATVGQLGPIERELRRANETYPKGTWAYPHAR